MSQKNDARHLSNCQITVESTVTSRGSFAYVPQQKKKEQAQQTLYLNRV